MAWEGKGVVLTGRKIIGASCTSATASSLHPTVSEYSCPISTLCSECTSMYGSLYSCTSALATDTSVALLLQSATRRSPRLRVAVRLYILAFEVCMFSFHVQVLPSHQMLPQAPSVVTTASMLAATSSTALTPWRVHRKSLLSGSQKVRFTRLFPGVFVRSSRGVNQRLTKAQLLQVSLSFPPPWLPGSLSKLQAKL